MNGRHRIAGVRNPGMRRKCRPLLAIIWLTVAAGLPAEPLTLQTFADDVRAQLMYDSVGYRGFLLRGRQLVSFTVDNPVFRVNGQEPLLAEPVRFQAGELVLPEASVDALRNLLQPTRPAGRRYVSTIFIDAGHGGRDPGAIGRHRIDGQTESLAEKDVVLDVALRLRDLLNAEFPDRTILMSRDDDRYLSLDERTDIANAIEVDEFEHIVFISIHANAALNPGAAGFEVWYLPPEYRRNVIDRLAVQPDDPSVIPILNSLLEEELTVESVLLGDQVLDGLEERIGTYTPNRGLRREVWWVVRNATMPSVLVELGFLTNRAEFQRLQTDPYRDMLAAGIFAGIVNFVDDFESVVLNPPEPGAE